MQYVGLWMCWGDLLVDGLTATGIEVLLYLPCSRRLVHNSGSIALLQCDDSLPTISSMKSSSRE